MPAIRRLAFVLAIGSAAAACQMTSEWWIQKSLQRAGYSKAEARCASRGVISQLTEEQLYSIRRELSGAERPDRFDNAMQLLGWLQPRLDPNVHAVLVHYAQQCRAAAAHRQGISVLPISEGSRSALI